MKWILSSLIFLTTALTSINAQELTKNQHILVIDAVKSLKEYYPTIKYLRYDKNTYYTDSLRYADYSLKFYKELSGDTKLIWIYLENDIRLRPVLITMPKVE